MYFTYNMGIGFCIVLSPEDVDSAHAIARKHNVRSYTIGHTFSDPERKVLIPSANLTGFNDQFIRAK
jgi:phosphoribosylformylglycinamidine cyclo-ligase